MVPQCDYSLCCDLLQVLSLFRIELAAAFCSENCLRTYARICFPACSSCLDKPSIELLASVNLASSQPLQHQELCCYGRTSAKSPYQDPLQPLPKEVHHVPGLDWTSQRNKRHGVDADQDQMYLPSGVRAYPVTALPWTPAAILWMCQV